MTEKNKNIFSLLLVLAMLGWGASWVNAKILSNYINEFEMVFFRFSITAITIIPIILVLKKSFKVNLKTLFIAAITAMFFLAYMKYYFLGTKFGTASLGGAFVTTLIPIITFLFLVLLGTKKMNKKDIFALSLGAIGVMTILNVWQFKLDEILVIHNLYFIFAALLWPVITILSSKAVGCSPIVFTFYLYVFTTLFAGVFFIDFKEIAYESFDSIFWINLFIISIIASTFSNSIYFLGIEKLGASEVSNFIFLVPFFAIVLSVIFLGEEIKLPIIIGTILTLFAIKILNNISFKKKR
ncbi:MAG: DMT family transporter [Arcobacteraceae bacterium]